MDRLNEHKVGARRGEKTHKATGGNKKSCGFNDGRKMFNAQMKLKINEREATAFWIMFEERMGKGWGWRERSAKGFEKRNYNFEL